MDGTAQNNTDSANHTDAIQGWFGRIFPLSFFDSLKEDLEIIENRGIFTLRVTTWMMMMQRLSPSGTLDAAVSELLHGNGRELECSRHQVVCVAIWQQAHFSQTDFFDDDAP